MSNAFSPLPMYFDRLAVLTVVHVEGNERVISFRRASRDERAVYHEWLKNEFE